MMRFLPLVLIAACIVGGCGNHGHKMDPNVVNSIQNGDSRSEVEKKLGEPDFEDLPDGGICHVRYTFAGDKGDALSCIPYVNMFAGGHQIRLQELEITYKDDVVQKKTFSDNTMRTSGGLVNMRVKQKPTPGAHPPTLNTRPSTAQPE